METEIPLKVKALILKMYTKLKTFTWFYLIKNLNLKINMVGRKKKKIKKNIDTKTKITVLYK